MALTHCIRPDANVNANATRHRVQIKFLWRLAFAFGSSIANPNANPNAKLPYAFEFAFGFNTWSYVRKRTFCTNALLKPLRTSLDRFLQDVRSLWKPEGPVVRNGYPAISALEGGTHVVLRPVRISLSHKRDRFCFCACASWHRVKTNSAKIQSGGKTHAQDVTPFGFLDRLQIACVWIWRVKATLMTPQQAWNTNEHSKLACTHMPWRARRLNSAINFAAHRPFLPMFIYPSM